MNDPVLVATDLSQGADEAIRQADVLARHDGSLRADILSRLQASLERFRAKGEPMVVDGPASVAIVKAARELPAELVVVGTRGRTGLSRLTLGSVAEAVLSSAPCSVLVVRLGQA